MKAFSVEGTIDGESVQAVYGDGVLLADSALFDRARLVVALGDRFEDGPVKLAASLTGPPEAVLLTLIRACDAPTTVEIEAAARDLL
jgi:hypothetical protein